MPENPMFSARHYRALADVFAAQQPAEASALVTWARIVTATAKTLAADNPRFDRARFIEACERK